MPTPLNQSADSLNQDVPIVVAAFDRPDSLSRLLLSLSKATYKKQVKLIISIDGGGAKEVYNISERFVWEHGEKEVVLHKNHFGLKDHIILCGNLSLEHDAIILLEDDLYVSPVFHPFALEALYYYKDDLKIAGISLYAHSFNETAWLPFIPISDGSDVFFMQYPSSWGQIWSNHQWRNFMNWYNKSDLTELNVNDNLPNNILKWPSSSWKKDFLKYMIVHDNFFVYPRESYTTNFGDPGANFTSKLSLFQRPLPLFNKTIQFKRFDDSIAVYDSACEMLPEKVKTLNNSLELFDFEVDLYGTKELNKIRSKYIMTSRLSTKPILQYGCELKPMEMNIIHNIEGNFFSFSELKNVKPYKSRLLSSFKFLFPYFYRDVFLMEIIALLYHKIIGCFKK